MFFKNYSWPGNVRELKNVIQRLLFYDKKLIGKADAKNALGSLFMANGEDKFKALKNVFEDNILPLSTMEKLLREKYLIFVRENSESDSDAARKLGLAPSNFYRMAKELGIK